MYSVHVQHDVVQHVACRYLRWCPLIRKDLVSDLLSSSLLSLQHKPSPKIPMGLLNTPVVYGRRIRFRVYLLQVPCTAGPKCIPLPPLREAVCQSAASNLRRCSLAEAHTTLLSHMSRTCCHTGTPPWQHQQAMAEQGGTQCSMGISECFVLHVSGGGGGAPPVHLSSSLLNSLCAAGSGP